MAAITATRSQINQAETHLFYCSSDQNVEYQSFDDADADQITLEPSDVGNAPNATAAIENAAGGAAAAHHEAATRGPLANPGSLVAFFYHNEHELPMVYGIRNNGHISMFVPGIRPLRRSPRTTKAALAGCSDGAQQAWLYYITTDNVDPPRLTQYTMNGAVVAPLSNIPADVVTPDPDTALTAYYLPGGQPLHACIFQGHGNNALKFVQYTEHQPGAPSTGEIASTNGALHLTPLATVVIGPTVLLYYLNQQRRLHRTHRTIAAGWTGQISQVGDTEWGPGPITATASADKLSVTIRQIGADNYLTLAEDQVNAIVNIPL